MCPPGAIRRNCLPPRPPVADRSRGQLEGPRARRPPAALGSTPAPPGETDAGRVRALLGALPRPPLPGLPGAARPRAGALRARVGLLVRLAPRRRAPRPEPPGDLLLAGDVH